MVKDTAISNRGTSTSNIIECIKLWWWYTLLCILTIRRAKEYCQSQHFTAS